MSDPRSNGWQRWIVDSYQSQTGLALAAGQDIYRAPQAVLCHRLGPDPLFVYANQFAQRLWERPWDQFVGLPSRLTAPPGARQDRADALSGNQLATGYSGERISATGRRFRIRDATIWPVSDDSGEVVGQAATFSQWVPVERDLLEILATTAPGVRSAIAAGADRIELCVDYEAGGTTPPIDLIHEAVADTTDAGVGVMVMIRPRGGDFVYSDTEVLTMERSIEAAVTAGCAGLVWGCLTPEGVVDRAVARRLMGVAPEVPATFHRAVDVSTDPVAAALAAFGLGCDRVLTSGGAPTALQGADVIADIVRRAPATGTVLAGSGVRHSSAARVRELTGVTEVHASAAYFAG